MVFVQPLFTITCINICVDQKTQTLAGHTEILHIATALVIAIALPN